MITKLFTTPTTHAQVQINADLRSIRRLLAAAVIDPDFCNLLINHPLRAVTAGFGGEEFPLSAYGLEAIRGIRADSLNQFTQLLNEKLPIF